MDLCELTENECIGGVVDELVNVWSSGHTIESIKGMLVQSHLLPFHNLGSFVHLALPVCFGRS